MMGEDVAADATTDGATARAGTSAKASNAAAKKKAALWNKQAKNLKIKDQGKKIEAIEFCAHNEMFLQEPEVLSQLISFLSRVKVNSVPVIALISIAVSNGKLILVSTEDAGGDRSNIANF